MLNIVFAFIIKFSTVHLAPQNASERLHGPAPKTPRLASGCLVTSAKERRKKEQDNRQESPNSKRTQG